MGQSLLGFHLLEWVRPGIRDYPAAFTPGEHRKLTRWVAAEPLCNQAYPHKPYFWTGRVVFPKLPTLARELRR